jgi:hypothetical protein
MPVYILLPLCIDGVDSYSPATSLSTGCQVQAKAVTTAGPYSTAHRLRQLDFTKEKRARALWD